VIDGGGGNDLICGGRGNDVLIGGPGNDTVIGGPGNDFLIGGTGNDRLKGGRGRDVCGQNSGTGALTGCERIVTRAATLAPGQSLRTDAEAAALVRRTSWEPRPENKGANHTVPTERVPWAMTKDQLYWKKWIRKRKRVTGAFTGTTGEILQWSAYKWGIDEEVVRAVAWQESGWHQFNKGDYANGYYHSFGLMSIRDSTNSSPTGAHNAFGGYPWTSRATALNVDFFGAWIRSCLDGVFYDGGSWLYHGKRVKGDLWGCLGAWYSGDWYDGGASAYIARVKQILGERPWRHWR